MNLYTTGQFAKKSNVTIRTIRYYDSIGLLKPSHIADNGYRYYSNQDLIKLQRIISLKNLGFSLDEIYPLTLKNDKESFLNSLNLQYELADRKISSLEILKENILNTKKILQDEDIDWNKIIRLIQLSQYGEEILKHYHNSNHLNVRIMLHEKYSVNKLGWFDWVFSCIDFSYSNRILEVGCGDGKLWENRSLNLRNREVFLSDISKGMIEDAKKRLTDNFSYMVFDCEHIPFKKNYFDIVIANHVLFYLNDIDSGLYEIYRVLDNRGTLYCSTYGRNHMKEINDLVAEFDNRIQLSKSPLYENFGLQNGKGILKKYFKRIELKIYQDCLEIDKSEDLIAYIMSCHGNQNEILKSRLDKFKLYLDEKLSKSKYIKITKEVGIFICRKL